MPKKTKQAEIPNDRSLDELRNQVVGALAAKYLLPTNAPNPFWVRELYPDRAIVTMPDNTLLSFPYTVTAEGVELGEPTTVEMEFVPTSQAASQSRAGSSDHQPSALRLIQALDAEGWVWEVLLLAPGLGANNQYFPTETLQQSATVFEGARVFCLDESQHSRTGDKSAKQMVGWVENIRYDEGRGLVGRLVLLKAADWLRQNLLDSHAKGKPDLYGLSVDAPGEAVMKQVKELANKAVLWFTKILSPATVDVVWNPGTPGGFQRALNAVAPSRVEPSKEERMKEQLLKILQAKRPDLYGTIDPAAVTEEQLVALLEKAMTPAPSTGSGQAQGQPTQVQNATPAFTEEDRTIIQQAKVLHWNGQIAPLITESKLPEVMQASLRKRFLDLAPAEGTEKGLEQVKQAIEDYRKVVDSLSEEGRVRGLGFAHGLSTTPEIERLQQALDKTFGLTVQGDVPPFTGIRQAYARITGDSEVSGFRSSYTDQQLAAMSRAAQAFWSAAILENGDMRPGFFRIEQSQVAATWPLLLGNTLYRRLVMDYAQQDYGENRVISTRRRANDFRTIESIRLQYAADLPVVNPEVADYTEAPALGEEGVNYAVSTRGRIMTVSRKSILNDDLQAVVRLPQREGRAARRTFARTVWNLAINNATYDGDAVAWFHASHGNLGSTALTANAAGITALVAALNDLMNQTEPGSAEKLGGAWWSTRPLLTVPTALQDVAKQINQSNGIPGAANQGDNPVYGLFGSEENPERIFVNPLFVDTSDWYVFRQPADVGIIEVAFLRGQETPEVFVADSPVVGQMFMADKLQYKIRHEYGAEIEDFRGGRKAVV